MRVDSYHLKNLLLELKNVVSVTGLLASVLYTIIKIDAKSVK